MDIKHEYIDLQKRINNNNNNSSSNNNNNNNNNNNSNNNNHFGNASYKSRIVLLSVFYDQAVFHSTGSS